MTWTCLFENLVCSTRASYFLIEAVIYDHPGNTLRFSSPDLTVAVQNVVMSNLKLTFCFRSKITFQCYKWSMVTGYCNLASFKWTSHVHDMESHSTSLASSDENQHVMKLEAFYLSQKKTVERMVGWLVNCNALALMWCHRNVNGK